MSVLPFAEAIAAEAGALALEFWRRRDSLAVAHKNPLDVVTDADHDVERFVRERIRASFPDDKFHGEESVRETSAEGRTWLVDPIDGTLNFVRGIEDWAISIGVLEGGRLVAGVIEMPARDIRIAGGAGVGACCNGDALPRCSDAAPADLIVGIGLSARTLPDYQLAVVREVVESGFSFRRNGSSAATLAMLVRRQIDAFIAVGQWAWDVAAGLAIAEALGYASSLEWDRIDLAQRLDVVCAPPALLPKLMPITAAAGG